MIISGGSRSNWRFFASHLMNAKDNERVNLVEVRGLAGENVREAFREIDALASGTRCKNSFYHANINPREDEHLTPQQWELAVDTLEKNLGLEGHSRFVVEHEKNGRTHRHVIWSRIDVDSMTAVSDSYDFKQHQRTSRELEAAFDHQPTPSAHERDERGRQKERRPKSWETFRGKKTRIDPAKVKEEVSAAWREADSGRAFKAALEERGYVLCKGDKRDFAIIDRHGDEHNLARRVEGVRTADLRARLADIDRQALPSVAEGRARQRQQETVPATPAPAPKPSATEAPRDRSVGVRVKALSVINAREVGSDERQSATWRERWGKALGRARDVMRERMRAGWEATRERLRVAQRRGAQAGQEQQRRLQEARQKERQSQPMER